MTGRVLMVLIAVFVCGVLNFADNANSTPLNLVQEISVTETQSPSIADFDNHNNNDLEDLFCIDNPPYSQSAIINGLNFGNIISQHVQAKSIGGRNFSRQVAKNLRLYIFARLKSTSVNSLIRCNFNSVSSNSRLYAPCYILDSTGVLII